MCGEYGDKTKRPHYHAAMFNLHINDHQEWDQKLTTSKTIDKLWQKGSVKIGALTFQSARYVAAYCTKKITGEKAITHYERCDPQTGEIYTLQPEYARMSLKPGLARKWIEKYTDDVYNFDHVVINGKKQKAPRYYDKYLEATNQARLEKHKQDRQKKGQMTKGENKPERLNAREIVTTARHKQQQRTI